MAVLHLPHVLLPPDRLLLYRCSVRKEERKFLASINEEELL